jgi:hypothetical protein
VTFGLLAAGILYSLYKTRSGGPAPAALPAGDAAAQRTA